MKWFKTLGEIIVTIGIMVLIGAVILIGAVALPIIALIGGVFILGLIIFFMVHDPTDSEKPTE